MSRQSTAEQIERLSEGRLLCQSCDTERPVWLFRRISFQGPPVPRHWSQECVPCEHADALDYRAGLVDTPPVDPWAALIGADRRNDGLLRGFPSAVARARRQARRAGAPVDYSLTAREIRDSLPWTIRGDVIALDFLEPSEGFRLENLEPITASELIPDEDLVPA